MTYGLTNEGPGLGGRRGGRGPGGAAGSTNAAAARTNATSTGRGPGGRGGGNPFSGAAAAFEVVLLDELIPYVDANFRTLADQPHRAMAGLSMGAMQTRAVTLANLDKFSHIGLFSGGTISMDDVNNTAGFKAKVKLVFVSYGSREIGAGRGGGRIAGMPGPPPAPAATGRGGAEAGAQAGRAGAPGGMRGFGGDPQASIDALKAAGINAAFYVSPLTAHEFQSWRRSLREFALLLFKDKVGGSTRKPSE